MKTGQALLALAVGASSAACTLAPLKAPDLSRETEVCVDKKDCPVTVDTDKPNWVVEILRVEKGEGTTITWTLASGTFMGQGIYFDRENVIGNCRVKVPERNQVTCTNSGTVGDYKYSVWAFSPPFGKDPWVLNR